MPTVPSQQFFLSSQDLTGATSVTAAQLNNILLAGYPFGDKGMIIWTTDGGSPNVPDAVTYPVFTTCIWGRIQPTTSLVTLYFWNPNTGSVATYAKWQSLFQGGIPAGSITGGVAGMIAAATITGYNIANGAIIDAAIASVSGAKVVTNTLPLTAILLTGVANQLLAVNSGGSALTYQTAPLIYTNFLTNELSIATSALQDVQVNASGTGYQFSTHRVLQTASYQTSAGQTSTVYLAVGSFPMTTGNADLITGFGSGGTVTFTPLSTTSKIFIEATVNIGITGTAPSSLVGLFMNGSLIDFTCVTGALPQKALLTQSIANASLTSRAFTVYMVAGASGGSGGVSINESGGVSTLKITEYI